METVRIDVFYLISLYSTALAFLIGSYSILYGLISYIFIKAKRPSEVSTNIRLYSTLYGDSMILAECIFSQSARG